MVGHGLQALLDVHQAHVQRAFLASLLGPFQKLLGLQHGLPLLFPGLPGPFFLADLAVDPLA